MRLLLIFNFATFLEYPFSDTPFGDYHAGYSRSKNHHPTKMAGHMEFAHHFTNILITFYGILWCFA
jgi:hypothetical protein